MNLTNYIEAKKIKKNVEKRIHSKPNVVATGIGYKNGDPEQGLAIITSVTEKKPRGFRKGHVSRLQAVAKSYDGLQTDVIGTGKYRALFLPTTKHRPIPQGVSIGHKNITAGTVGAWVNYKGEKVLLSNNHVLANSNNAVIGDEILQPGPYDGGTETVAHLENFVPIDFGQGGGGTSDCDIAQVIVMILNFLSGLLKRDTELEAKIRASSQNLVDAALAKPVNPELILDSYWDTGLKISGVGHPKLGDFLKKYGRTTGYTEDKILQTDVTVTVSYGDAGNATFVNQLMAGGMSAGGDSGSTVLNQMNQVVGLLFAGSETTTILNPIQFVIDALGLTF